MVDSLWPEWGHDEGLIGHWPGHEGSPLWTGSVRHRAAGEPSRLVRVSGGKGSGSRKLQPPRSPLVGRHSAAGTAPREPGTGPFLGPLEVSKVDPGQGFGPGGDGGSGCARVMCVPVAGAAG